MVFALSSFKSETKKELNTQTYNVEVTSVQNDDEEGTCTYTLSFTNSETGQTKTSTHTVSAENYGECFFYYRTHQIRRLAELNNQA